MAAAAVEEAAPAAEAAAPVPAPVSSGAAAGNAGPDRSRAEDRDRSATRGAGPADRARASARAARARAAQEGAGGPAAERAGGSASGRRHPGGRPPCGPAPVAADRSAASGQPASRGRGRRHGSLATLAPSGVGASRASTPGVAVPGPLSRATAGTAARTGAGTPGGTPGRTEEPDPARAVAGARGASGLQRAPEEDRPLGRGDGQGARGEDGGRQVPGHHQGPDRPGCHGHAQPERGPRARHRAVQGVRLRGLHPVLRGRARPGPGGGVEAGRSLAAGPRHHRDGPRRPRQDIAPRRHPRDLRGFDEAGGITQHIGAYHVDVGDAQGGLPRHPGSRGLHPDAGSRGPGDGHRGPGGGGRRRGHAPDAGGHRSRQGRRSAHRGGGEQDRQAGCPARPRAPAAG